MASWMVHLRIADALLAHWRQLDEEAFILGNIAPDSGVPNEDWSAFRPPKAVSHFQTADKTGHFIDTELFRSRYLNAEAVQGYSLREYSFFLGYFVHLLTDVRWAETVYATLKTDHPEEYAADKSGLVQAAKEDWYDLDFLYLEQHPDFKAFSVYENAPDLDNTFLDLFSRDAFENRRQYICGFYRSSEHGELHREYRYLTPREADAFVRDTANRILEQLGGSLSR